MPLNEYDKTTYSLGLIKLRLYYYWGPTVARRITTDWVCVKIDVSRMFHKGDKVADSPIFFTNIRLKIQVYLCKNCCKQ